MKTGRFISASFSAWAGFACLLTVMLSATALPAQQGSFTTKVKPFFKQHCYRCHGPDREEGGLRVDQLKADLNDLDSVDQLRNILDELTTDSMPPEEEPQPSSKSLAEVCKILTRHIERAKEKHSSGGGRPVRRLSRTEYVNTVYDLLGVHVAPDTLPADGAVGSFDTDAVALYLTDLHFETYLEASREAVRRFIASRNEEPGERAIKTKLSSAITRGSPAVFASDVPPAGHLIVRLSCWNRDPGPAFLSTSKRSYEVVGTASKPQTIDLEFFKPEESVSLKYSSAGAKSAPSKKLSKQKQKAVAKFKLTPETLLEAQDFLVKNPILLGEIQNIKVVSHQPYDFFKAALPRGDRRLADSAAKPIIEKFSELISRGRSPDSKFVAGLNRVFLLGRKQGMPFWEAMVEPLAISMCSIEFLMHFENRDPRKASERITGIDFANRLSYFLWRSAPDEELIELGRAEKLFVSKIKVKQVERMMKDKRFDRFLRDFTDQWLELERQDQINVDKRLFPKFEERLKSSLKEETVQFVSHVIRENLPLNNLIDSDFMVLNNATAKHYGVAGVRGDEFRPVERKPGDKNRGGILTHAGILMQTGTGERTSVVERGAFVARKILNTPPPPPPPNVAELPTDDKNSARLTAAALVKKHANTPQCAACHNKIDPLGLGLEEFDAIGLFRTKDKRIDPEFTKLKKKQKRNRIPIFEVPLETRGKVLNKKSFQGINGFKKALLANDDRLSDAYIEALLYFANGRKSGVADEDTVKDITKRASKFDFPARAIIKAVIYSDAFTAK